MGHLHWECGHRRSTCRYVHQATWWEEVLQAKEWIEHTWLLKYVLMHPHLYYMPLLRTKQGKIGWHVLTPMEAHRDKIHKRIGIKVVFTQSIIEYRFHMEMCVCRLTTSLSRDSNQGLRYEYRGGVPIFRQVQDKQRFVRRATHRSGFRSQRPKPCNLSTTSPLAINRVTIRLTSPRRLIPATNRRTQARTR